jgi:hypothetical protein
MLSRKGYIFLLALFLFVLFMVCAVQQQDRGAPVPAGDGQAPPSVARATRILLPDTIQETTLFIITAEKEGPVVMVMGGVHGDEIAGYLAADIIAAWSVDRGTLLVLPRANAHAVQTNTRYPPGTDNLNASFPGNAAGNPTERLAAAIYRVMEEYRPQWVVDLHEAWEFERVQPYQLGQTIIYPEDAPSLEIVEQIIQGLNSSIPEELHRFQVKRGGVYGGTIYASLLLGLESFTVETTRKLPLEDRIRQHLEAVRLLMPILGVKVYENDSE